MPSKTHRKTLTISEEAADKLARIISHLLDKTGAYYALLQDAGIDPGDDERTDRLLIAGQRIVHSLRNLENE